MMQPQRQEYVGRSIAISAGSVSSSGDRALNWRYVTVFERRLPSIGEECSLRWPQSFDGNSSLHIVQNSPQELDAYPQEVELAIVASRSGDAGYQTN